MKKAILSLAAVCVLTTLSSEKLMSAASNVYQSSDKKLNNMSNLSPLAGLKTNSAFSLVTLAPVTYRNLKPDAGHVEIDDLTTGLTYSADLPPTTGSQVGNTGISLSVGDILEVTVYSGNGNCSITCNGSTETGVSSMYISQSFLPNPSWIVIQ